MQMRKLYVASNENTQEQRIVVVISHSLLPEVMVAYINEEASFPPHALSHNCSVLD